jgi:uncharacterized protein YggT (Ycf19 family)
MLDHVIGLATLTGWLLKIYSWMHIGAFLLSWINADPNNRIVFFVRRTTLPLWNWVGQKLPYRLTAFSPIFALMLVIFAEIAVPGMIRSIGAVATGHLSPGDGFVNAFFYLIYAGLYIVASIIGFIFLLAIVWFVFTLVNPSLNNPIVRAIMVLIDPLISPLQRFMPRTRIDLSSLALALIAFLSRSALYQVILPLQTSLLI